MRIVQVRRANERRVGIVAGDRIELTTAGSVFHTAWQAGLEGVSLAALFESMRGPERLSYDELLEGRSDWRLLPCADHPDDPSHCLVSGTGLTHASSARNRQAMHATQEEQTDSLRMYLWGVEGGRPTARAPGIAPEWFYKGDGGILRAHGEPLTIPFHAEDGGEEPEIAGVYLVDASGRPRRIGLAQGNEFSDHVHERRNYLYLAESKLRECSIGPELCLDADFTDVAGEVRVERGGAALWAQDIRSGESAMCHSLANIEHHHFKHAQHQRPGTLHVHFLGADAFSFGAGVGLKPGDVMQVRFEGFGRPLRNPLALESGSAEMVRVESL